MFLSWLWRRFELQPWDLSRCGFGAALLFLLVGANNLIKIVRDSVFLGHHSAAELPYLYVVVALIAGPVIAVYSKHASKVSLPTLILRTNAVLLLCLGFFWVVLTKFDWGWSHYAFYIWSAMAGVIALAQAWTLLSEIFSQADGERLFGLITAGGTVGGAAAAFGSKWLLAQGLDVEHFLCIAVALIGGASLLVANAKRSFDGKLSAADLAHAKNFDRSASPGQLLRQSRYLQAIALLILVGVIVSTLIDFEFKSAAKQVYPSKNALAAFFSAYYGWLSVVTFFAQSVLTAKVFRTLGLFPSLYVTPSLLLAGLLAMLSWPGLLAASLTRMAETVLRNSVQRSSLEILYLPLSSETKKSVKTFLDVVVERIGDATAGFVILAVTFWRGDGSITQVHFLCLGLIAVWMLLIPALRKHHREPTAVADMA